VSAAPQQQPHVGGGNNNNNPTHLTAHGAIKKPTVPPRRTKVGLTYSRNGVPLTQPPNIMGGGVTSGKGSRRRRNYPLSWGAAPEQMKMKKRVLCVYDGQRRLWKDDMMLDVAHHEVRIPLREGSDGVRGPWVTDLDVLTLRRAEGILGATEEEKGPWVMEEEIV